MLKALKVLIIIWAAYSILAGLGLVFMPQQLGAMAGYATGGPAHVRYFLTLLGISMIVPNAFLIAAMTRDILRNILWVQFAISVTILTAAVGVYSMLMGFVTFQQVGTGVIIGGAFFIAFMALYPWGRTEE